MYGILDHEAIPPKKLAVLAKGLPAGSRIWAEVAKIKRAKERDSDLQSFDDPEDFEAARAKIIQRLEGDPLNGN